MGFASIFITLGLGTRFRSSKVQTRKYPNEGIWRSLKNFLLTSFLFGLTLGIPFGKFYGVFVGLLFGLANGPIFGMTFGGSACIQHFILRLILVRDGFIPWDYRQFLDYADDLMLLKKEGGAYAFIDPSLQEYFAEMNANGSMEQQ
jgi:eukaryotic-like serine/threonine-protein kinase